MSQHVAHRHSDQINAELVERLERVLMHDPKAPGLDFGGDWPLLVESIMSSIRAALRSATETKDEPT